VDSRAGWVEKWRQTPYDSRGTRDGYVEALRATHADVPESADYVAYWWNHAAKLVRKGEIRRFGFIATNSLKQTFNRRIIESHLTADDRLSLIFAICGYSCFSAP
jgi:hypothetical protein